MWALPTLERLNAEFEQRAAERNGRELAEEIAKLAPEPASEEERGL